MDQETNLIVPESSAPKSTAAGKMKTALCRVCSYLLLGIGIPVIGVMAVPPVVLIMMIVGVWSFLDRILSVLDQNRNAQTAHERHVDPSEEDKACGEDEI